MRVAAAGALLCSNTPAILAEDVIATVPLKIESLDVSQAPGLGPPPRPAEPKSSWRTSFGSERRTEAPTVPVADPAAFDADVVLLQGVTAVRSVRRVFPARDWRLVFSRQVLMSDDPLNPWSRDAVAEVPTTAVAVRYREGLRVSGQEHLLKLIEAGPGAAQGSAVSAAGTAVRLTHGGAMTWVVSVSLAATCTGEPMPCASRRVLDQWLAGKHALGEAVVVGGALEIDVARPLPPPPCSSQSIEAEGAGEAGGAQRFAAEHTAAKGCVAVVVVGR